MTAIREALDAAVEATRYSNRQPKMVLAMETRHKRDAALAELDALEAVAEAARHIRSSVAACTCLHIEGGQVIECWPCIERKWHKELMAALARLAAIQDGQTRGDGA